MENRDYKLELLEILNSNLSDEEKKAKLLSYHDNDIAEVVDELDENQRTELFKILGDDKSGDVLAYSENISDVIEDLEPSKAADIIESMDADDAIDVLEELDDSQREEIVSLMDQEAKEDIQEIAKHDDDEIGSKMTNNFVTIHNTDTVKSATKRVIKEAAENDNISTIFVLDENEKFYGVLNLRDLIIARENTDLKSIIKTNYPYFNSKTPVADIINDLKDYAMDSYPIVNDNNELIGVITSDDVVEVLDAETGEDYAKLAGLTDEEDQDGSIFSSIRKRIPWLLILLVLDLVLAFTMTGFENVVEKLPIIVFFQTMILDMAGNTGTQSLGVTIRLLSTRDVGAKDVLKTIFKEIRIGFFNGLILAALAFGFVFLYLFIAKKGVEQIDYTTIQAVKAAGIVGAALISAMTVSATIGTVTPILFKKIHIDPAVASGPFITTINDLTAMLIYFGLAIMLFNL